MRVATASAAKPTVSTAMGRGGVDMLTDDKGSTRLRLGEAAPPLRAPSSPPAVLDRRRRRGDLARSGVSGNEGKANAQQAQAKVSGSECCGAATAKARRALTFLQTRNLV